MKNYSEYTVKLAADESNYGSDCTKDEAARIVAELERRIAAQFPGINIEIERTLTTGRATTGPDTATCEEIDAWIEAHWAEALDAAVTSMAPTYDWTTKPQADSTHVIDDGGMIYWVAAPGKTNDQVAEVFKAQYDGEIGDYDVTEVKSGNKSDYKA